MTFPAQIKSAVLAALQPAEEIGGPDGFDYIRLMTELSAVCSARAKECLSHMVEHERSLPDPPLAQWEVLLQKRVATTLKKRTYVSAANASDAAIAAKEQAARILGFWFDAETSVSDIDQKSSTVFCTRVDEIE